MLPVIAHLLVSDLHDLGGTDIALDVSVTQEQEGAKDGPVVCHLLLFHNPDAQSSAWATSPARSATWDDY